LRAATRIGPRVSAVSTEAMASHINQPSTGIGFAMDRRMLLGIRDRALAGR